jgi:Rod binding domain-containing protein
MDTLPAIIPPLGLSLDDGAESFLSSRKEEANKQLEAVFISMLVKEMRTAGAGEDGGLFAGDASDTFGGMFDSFMGEELANAGGIGLQQLLQPSVVPNMNDLTTIHRQAKEAYRNAESDTDVTATSGS